MVSVGELLKRGRDGAAVFAATFCHTILVVAG